ncbi:hypothetical protein V6N11_061921 [Hibiscus sabdariffa]|uniref:RNase H type-1 domain-containing protein n=1 Tax=Hibiscus sabdariffa TaxID=183260 RepID=A0ABR2N7I6_9ROSI
MDQHPTGSITVLGQTLVIQSNARVKKAPEYSLYASLWKRRCGMVMDDNFVDQGDLTSRCQRLVIEISVNAVTQLESVNNVQREGTTVDRHWVKSMYGHVKANVDGACNLATNMAAAGETDSLEVASILRGTSKALSGHAIITNIRDLVVKEWNVTILCIPRSMNKGTNSLATSKRNQPVDVSLFYNPSEFVMSLVNMEKQDYD